MRFSYAEQLLPVSVEQSDFRGFVGHLFLHVAGPFPPEPTLPGGRGVRQNSPVGEWAGTGGSSFRQPGTAPASCRHLLAGYFCALRVICRIAAAATGGLVPPAVRTKEAI